MKELLRDKVTIRKEDYGFQIIIPKSYKYGKANADEMEMNEFVENYHVYKINTQDIIKLIKE